MRKCHSCSKTLTSGSRHIYTCARKNGSTETNDQIKFKFLNYNFPLISKKEKLQHVYENQLKSLPDIKKEYNIDFKSILFLLDYYDIKKRNNSESAKLISQDKYKNTCQNKYGVSNVSLVQLVKDKKSKTSLKNYGVDNIRKSPEFISWLKIHMNEKYGAGSLPNNNETADSWGWKKLTETEKQARLKKIHSNYKNNNLETKIQIILNEIGISYTSQFFIGKNSFDIKISGIKLLIEIQGDYWHANPNKYKPEDKIIYPCGPKLAKEVWQKDINKQIIAENKGYRIIYLWEDEINNKSNDELKLYLFEKIMLWKNY